MTYSKMPLRTVPKWPKDFGFIIVGDGPCFVLAVEKESVAYSSGLQPGDQLLELDNQDVTSMDAEVIKSLAKHSRTQPPTLGVVSRLLHVDVVGNKAMGLGFTVGDQSPITVDTVEEDGPSQTAGIRPGDIIIEVNGHRMRSPDDIKPLLPVHSRVVTITYIPVGKPSSPVTPVKYKISSKPVTEGSRVKRAKDLHDKMNDILGEDYEKKMAIVGVLKQYAEDRDTDMLARALSVILRTPQHRRLLRQIRPFIPPRQRLRFDDITRHQQEHMASIQASEGQTNGVSQTAHKIGKRRALRIVRGEGTFGFVIKGSNPAYIETVDAKGAAEKAGFQPGDFIMKLNGIDVRKCSHSHLVNLLQDSGTAPIIEILRCDEDAYVQRSPGALSNSSQSSTSSHAESDWLTPGSKLILDKQGKTYLEKAEYLLTNKERNHVRKAWVEYESTCNIVELFQSVALVLDTPSKKTLWMFILARLSPPHQQYCVNQISLPRNVLLECIEKHDSDTQMSQSWPADGESSSTSGWGSGKSSIKITSFQQQVEYLLTSRERSMLKKALQLYSENRNVDHLVEDLDSILDTSSKQTLWMYIVPLLTHPHQDIVRLKLNKSSSSSSSEPTQKKTSTKNYQMYLSSEDEEHDLFSRTGERKFRSKPGHGSVRGLDSSLIKELEETRRAVQEVKEFLRKDNKYITVIPVDQRLGGPGGVHSPYNVQIPGQPYPIAIDPSQLSGHHGDLGDTGFLGTHLDSRAFSNGSLGHSFYTSDQHQRPAFPANFMSSDYDSEGNVEHNNVTRLGVPPSFVISGPEENDGKLRIPANFMTSGTESDNESEIVKRKSAQLLVSKFAKMGGNTFNRHALTALKQLDAAVAAEVSELENLGPGHTGPGHAGMGDNSGVGPACNGETTVPVPPPPPPPPPPVAPPPPAPPLPGQAGADNPQMNVKRINWEKLDTQRVENTVWEQIGEEEDLQDVVRYLELEQYFSTKSHRQKLPEKKNEVCILNPKKSYNICKLTENAILLGHLKLSLGEIRQALYLLDEAILTPELLRQLLAYAPNKHEIEQFDSFNGHIEELSKPDRFTYEMSRVPGYEQRLKALVFKGNFQEKITEMKEHLQYIRKASLELRHSKKLSKILELILAMGNYMNQGNQRVGEAAGFKIRFLSQLEITKTSDNKLTFLHVLAEAVYSKFPELVAVGEELTTVPMAAKYSNVLLNQELQDLRKVLQATLAINATNMIKLHGLLGWNGIIGTFAPVCLLDVFNLKKTKVNDISNTLEKFGSQKTSIGINDKFQDVMGHFISQASDEIQGLFRLNANTMEEFQATVQYFGEDTKKVTTTELFGVFADFVTKFERAHRHNMMFKRYNNSEKT